MASLDAAIDAVLPWIVRLAGLFWLIGAYMLFRQIRLEMAIDRMTSELETASGEPAHAEDAWIDRDDAARRGWIAGQAVVLAATGIAMALLHPFASWLAALLVFGQGVYFIWREWTARRAPTPKAAAHARPSAATINAGWFSLGVAMLVWMAAFRGLLAQPL